jgi:hypothetical protein
MTPRTGTSADRLRLCAFSGAAKKQRGIAASSAGHRILAWAIDRDIQPVVAHGSSPLRTGLLNLKFQTISQTFLFILLVSFTMVGILNVEM